MRVPEQHDAGECGDRPEELGAPDGQDRPELRQLNQPDGVNDHDRRQRRLRHPADQGRKEQEGQERRATRDETRQLAAGSGQAVHGSLGRAAARRHAAEDGPDGRGNARSQQFLVGAHRGFPALREGSPRGHGLGETHQRNAHGAGPEL